MVKSAASYFETTVWTQVLAAAREPDSAAGQRSLARLCQRYWYPIYAYIRRRGSPPADAQDLTQGFFQHILTSGFLARVDPERGRFRYFLLGAVRHFLENDRERQLSQRRGGHCESISIDAAMAEQWLAAEPTAANDSARAFDRSWAIALLHAATVELELEQVNAGKGETFRTLKQFLQRTADPGEYDHVASQLRISKGAVAAAVHRLNERFGELVRQAVRDTLVAPGQAQEEMRGLLQALQE